MDEEDQLELMTVFAATVSICYNPSDTTPISIPEGLSTACHPLSLSCKTQCVTYLGTEAKSYCLVKNSCSTVALSPFSIDLVG